MALVPGTTAEAGWCEECVTISTLSGSKLLLVIASDASSRTGGMWFSVWMWLGMAGDEDFRME
jgi:hypothetical protein